MNLARRKICLQIPANAKPDDWPVGWDFPPLQAWPPGYPRKFFEPVTLDAVYAPQKTLIVWCLDKHGEHTDILNGQSLHVKAEGRIRQPGSTVWSEYGIFKICEFEPCKWGVHVDLELESTGPIFVHLFGFESDVNVTVKG